MIGRLTSSLFCNLGGNLQSKSRSTLTFKNSFKTSMNKYFGRFVISTVVLFSFSLSLKAQVNAVQFGKNRVQYQKFNWKYYQTENFNTYFSQDGLELGKYVAQVAEK